MIYLESRQIQLFIYLIGVSRLVQEYSTRATTASKMAEGTGRGERKIDKN